MSIYAIWNNKGGVGKSYLTFQISCEYARQHPNKKVLVVDMCPQANSSSMLLGGMIDGETRLSEIHTAQNRKTISSYMDDRISSPYVSTNTGAQYLTKVNQYNNRIPENLFLITGDEKLELQSSRVSSATFPGPDEAWRIVHLWAKDLISDVQYSWDDNNNSTTFIDCNPSFSIYTELALTAADRLIIPFSADGSSKRAVRAVLALLYGIRRHESDPQSEFFLNSERYRMALPEIYMYIGNRLTQMNNSSASAFKTVVTEIGQEIYDIWQNGEVQFCVHPNGSARPTNKKTFKKMFQYEVRDANTASVFSGATGIPITQLTAGQKKIAGRTVTVNQSQLDKQVPNITDMVKTIE